MEQKSFFARWRANFATGLVIVLPGVVSIMLLIWLFFTISNITDTLLIFIPKTITHQNNGDGRMYWYWSLVALLVAILLISVAGRLARNYFGKKMIEWVERVLMHVPLLNKFYGAIRQVNEAFTTGKKDSFKTVVLVEFPREGMHTIGFITSEQHNEVQQKMKEKVVCVFVPTTPNPTAGFLILVPEEKVIKLDMSVAEGIKYVVSLGSIFPEHGTPSKIQ
ncbi:MAG: DUF502 domain-containing protein [Verrucomicrobiota bacterium]|jgi:uncharacterized membrane protein